MTVTYGKVEGTSSGSDQLRADIITNIHKLLFAAKNIAGTILRMNRKPPYTYIKAHQADVNLPSFACIFARNPTQVI